MMNLHKLAKTGEFSCKNGLCINSENRCDNAIDCVDHSDEENCDLVSLPKIKNHVDKPPAPETIKRFPTLPKKHSTKVKVFLDLFNILDINEVTSEISLIFSISLQWKDERLKFLFLKNELHP